VTATPTATTTPDFSEIEIFSSKVYDVSQNAGSAAGVSASDYSSLNTNSLESSDLIVIPPIPSSPPVIPSGSPAYTKTSTYGTVVVATVDWYYYVTGLVDPKTWMEWKEKNTYYGTVIDYAYGQISQPTPQAGGVTVSRGFTTSRWTQDNTTLRVYSTGSGTYNTGNPENASFTGTQVIFLPTPVNGKQQIAYNFTCSSQSTGALNGTLTFENGSGTFARTAIDQSAIGTTKQYSQTTGSLNMTTPVNRTITFVHTMYGDGSKKLINNFPNITNTFNYNADSSGNGTVTGIPNTTITLVWDTTGTGTATIVSPQETKIVPIYVPYYFTPLLPLP